MNSSSLEARCRTATATGVVLLVLLSVALTASVANPIRVKTTAAVPQAQLAEGGSGGVSPVP
jgi:hypothetical protein